LKTKELSGYRITLFVTKRYRVYRDRDGRWGKEIERERVGGKRRY
jgi:hypothetical protein